jgi:hypothetical protein
VTEADVIGMTAGRELDALVAERVMGFVWYQSPYPRFRILFSPEEVARFDTADAPGYTMGQGPYQRVPAYSTDIGAAWPVFAKALTDHGSAAILADMEDFGRGAITRGKPDCVVAVRVGDWSVLGPAAEAICKATLLANLKAKIGEGD